MSDEKIKTAATKVPLEMVPLHALKGAARVFQHGAHKYAPGNFLQATIADGAVARYSGAMLRHLSDMQDPDGRWLENFNSLDAESGLPEIDHMLAGLIMARAIMVKEGKLPADPGISKLIQAVEAKPVKVGPDDVLNGACATDDPRLGPAAGARFEYQPIYFPITDAYYSWNKEKGQYVKTA